MDDENLWIWTDGSCSAQDRVGGWAFYASSNGVGVASRFGWEGNTTIGRMEITPIIRALEFFQLAAFESIVIHTDSQYTQRSIIEWGWLWKANGWRRSSGGEVRNRELIERAMELVSDRQGKVKVRWIKGHAGHFNNHLCDRMASDARRRKVSNWNGGLFTPSVLR